MPKRREQILQGMSFKQLVDVLSIFARAGGPMDVRRLDPLMTNTHFMDVNGDLWYFLVISWDVMGFTL